VGSGNVFQSFVNEHNWNGEFEDADPFFGVQIGDLEDGWEWWDVEDHEVETQGEEESSHKPDVQPWWHSDDRLVFGDTVQSVQQFNDDQNRQSHSHWVWVFKDLAVDTFEFWSAAQALHKVSQLVPTQCWTVSSVQEPPGSGEDGSESDVTTNSAVSEQQPVGDQSITR